MFSSPRTITKAFASLTAHFSLAEKNGLFYPVITLTSHTTGKITLIKSPHGYPKPTAQHLLYELSKTYHPN